MSIRKITEKQAIELATESYRETKIHEYVFNVPVHPEMGYGRARRGEIAGGGIREVWGTSELWEPICMDTPLVLASFRGDKTETRRLAKHQPKKSHKPGYYICDGFHLDKEHFLSAIADDAPYKPGDLLYVRERWQGYVHTNSEHDGFPTFIWWHNTTRDQRDFFDGVVWNFIYPDRNEGNIKAFRWLPSTHMPKCASRLWLEVVNCYPQFLQDITGDQCLAEGIMAYPEIYEEFKATAMYDTVDELHRMVFAHLWDMINGHRGDVLWRDNPLVWVTEYKRVDYGPFVNGGK